MRVRPTDLGALKAAVLMAGLTALLSGPAWTVFEREGLLDSGPRSAGMAGSDVAFPVAGVPEAPPAALAGVTGPAFFADYGFAFRGSVRSLRASACAPAEDIGLGLSFASRSYGGSRENRAGIALGIPVLEVPGLAFGATFRGLFADLGETAGRGSSLDISMVVPIPVPGPRVRLAVAGEDLFGWTRWEDGGREDLASGFRAGTSVEWEALGLSGEFRSVSGAGSRETILAAGMETRTRLVGLPTSIRAGFRDGSMRPSAVTAGAGLEAGGVIVDYALVVQTPEEGTIHLVGAGWRFGEGFRLPFGVSPVRRGRGPSEVVPSADVFAPRTAKESIRLRIWVPPGEPVTGWSILVIGPDGAVVWQESGEGAPPNDVRWAGAAREGLPVPDGEYLCRLMLRRGTAPVYLSDGSRLKVLHAFAQPRTVPAPPKAPKSLPVPEPEPARVAAEPAPSLAITALAAIPDSLSPGNNRVLEFSYEVSAPCELALIITGPGRKETRPLGSASADNLAGTVSWDGLGTDGRPVKAGTYRATLTASAGKESASRHVEFKVTAPAPQKAAPQKAAAAPRKATKPAAKKPAVRKASGR